MKMFRQLAAVTAMVCPLALANAAEVVIDLSANVDPTLSVLQANGSPMPQNLDLAYNAATGEMIAPTVHTRFYTNDVTQDVDVRLGSLATLAHATEATLPAIALTVRLDGQTITTANTALTAAQLWTGAVPGESKTLPLTISGRAQGANPPAAGRYVGRLEMFIVASAAGNR
ncbi:CS1 type fimbrial major subunit [Pandoraea sputorum]|uniref:CFA/I fimbrial subunit B n=1 Tax=Pandoraea sputorum TaxID=93222 RepID=A0A5E5AXM5_9BURK|nr:CS1 type fimbrial major subunit [Pandoraea sputorum]VVE78591.1 CFA/I fimbrial subunit B [Pandoraea sputorum]